LARAAGSCRVGLLAEAFDGRRKGESGMIYNQIEGVSTKPRVLRRRPVPKAADCDHRLANSLSLTAALLRMQRRHSTDAEVHHALLGAETRIVSIAKFYAYLHRCQSDARVDLADMFRDVLPDLGEAVGVRCLLAVNDGGPLDVPKLVARQVVIIVNELALNARRHGYGGRDGCISLELDHEGSDKLKLTFADSGVGLPDGFDPATCDGLGLRIVTSLVHEIRGTFAARSDGGAQFILTVPRD
jgi:two-component system, sensor histidine kinase PdtaS